MISVKNVLIKLKLLKMCFFEKRGWTKHPGNSPMSRAPDSSPFWGSSRKGDNRFILVELGRMAYGKKWLKLPLRSLRVLESSLSSVQAERLREWRFSVGSEVVHEAGEAGEGTSKTVAPAGVWSQLIPQGTLETEWQSCPALRQELCHTPLVLVIGWRPFSPRRAQPPRCFQIRRRQVSRERHRCESLVAHPQSSWRWVCPPALPRGPLRTPSLYVSWPYQEAVLWCMPFILKHHFHLPKEFLLSWLYSPSKAQESESELTLYCRWGLWGPEKLNNVPRPPSRAEQGWVLC